MKKTRRSITAEEYYEIKSYLACPNDDKLAMEVWGICKSTAQKIRRTRDYDEYREKSSTARRKRLTEQTVGGAELKRLEKIMKDNPLPDKREPYEWMPYEDLPTYRLMTRTLMLTILALVVGVIALILATTLVLGGGVQ